LRIIGSRDIDYDWKEGGEEWSAPWGGSAAQWFGAIFPRIHECLPASTILEIAPGFGRWTKYLKEHCERLHIVDPVEDCIEACRRRFGNDLRLSYHINDGRSLAMIPDRSIDFVFSFDSLVHVPRDTVAAYVRQLADKLKDDGVGFIHHSNLGEYASPVLKRLPRRVKKLLTKAKILDKNHQRAPDMTAELFRSYCAAHGLKCVCQELVNWRGRRLIDCFTTFARVGSKWAGACRILRNPNFMREAQLIRHWSQAYTTRPRGENAP
jgi:2-polyprenyl-3-methyl-5-hydroxy-6-metoxy-1,4-benzoquinol methylase